MSKSIAEQSCALSIFWLKKQGFLHKDHNRLPEVVTWTHGYSESKNSVNFTIRKDNLDTPEEKTYINLSYTHTNSWTGEKGKMDSKIELTTTRCNYGGTRYWFICPLYKDGRYCGRRVGVIYSIDKWFGCRHCGEIAYAKQMEGGRTRWNGISIPDIEQAEKEVKRYYYNGKPTRKYRRLIRMSGKFNNGFLLTMVKLKNKLGRSTDFKK